MAGPKLHFDAGSNDLGPLHSFGQILRNDSQSQVAVPVPIPSPGSQITA